MNIAFIGNSAKYTSHYGRVFHGVKETVQRSACVKSFIDPVSAVATVSAGSSSYIDSEVSALREFKPDVVFNSPFDTCSQIMMSDKANQYPADLITGSLDAIEEELSRAVPDNIERLRDPLDRDASTKDGFYKLCAEQNLPVPRTVVLRDLPPEMRRHGIIAGLLGGHESSTVVYKSTRGGCGMENFLVNKEKGFRKVLGSADGSDLIAQAPVPVGRIPFSMRVVTFGTAVIGGVLLVNPKGGFSSNGAQGGLGIGLALFGEEGRKDRVPDVGIRGPLLWDIFRQAGVDPNNRTIPDRILRLASLIGKLPSKNLLRGIDFVFDEAGAAFALECNCCPGPPGERMWADMTGTPAPLNRNTLAEMETEIAAELIAGAMERECKLHVDLGPRLPQSPKHSSPSPLSSPPPAS